MEIFVKIVRLSIRSLSRPIAVGAAAGLAVAAVLAVTPGVAALAAGPTTVNRQVGAHPVQPANVTVPPELIPPAGQVLVATFAANGVQVYRCTAGAWAFVEPAANLVGWAHGQLGVQTAVHFRGPSWESTVDGSLVEARAIASVPVTGSIPQLLLQATTTRGDGLFGHVTYVQRLATSGGPAPAGACVDSATTGVAYRAQYRFFQAAG